MDVNDSATFLPKTNAEELPAVRLGDLTVFVYMDNDGALCVTVDTEDMTGATPPIQLRLNSGTIFAFHPTA